ncbi:unnamed protein product [Rangifer tarandus platyrhynchus]|uniref:Uncharacterized protein n=1 Tax=Rangifer tarandus platyrhynchus TaxID=3082113 RepID=A0AC59Z394_RANTA
MEAKIRPLTAPQRVSQLTCPVSKKSNRWQSVVRRGVFVFELGTLGEEEGYQLELDTTCPCSQAAGFRHSSKRH